MKAIFLGLGFGLICGYIISIYPDKFSWLLATSNFFAEIFLRLLKMIIVPLIISSLVNGVSSISSTKNLGQLGLKTMGYYLITSLLAILTGLILVNLIQPGVGVDLGLQRDVKNIPVEPDSLLNIFIRMIPVNFLQAATEGQMLSIIFFSSFFGICISRIEREGRSLLTSLFKYINDVMMQMTNIILYTAPIGIWGLFTRLIATSGFDSLASLSWYALTVFLALTIHSTITLPIIISTIARKNPWKMFTHMRYALLTAFSTASSSATLPLTISNVEKNAKVPKKISSFTLPLGATINMDGTALYECVAVMFIAQAYQIELNLLAQLTIVVTALLASIGAAGIPMAGLVMMSVVLSSVGLPLEGVGLIIAVDRILDMCRTAVNVWSDSCGAIVISKIVK